MQNIHDCFNIENILWLHPNSKIPKICQIKAIISNFNAHYSYWIRKCSCTLHMLRYNFTNWDVLLLFFCSLFLFDELKFQWNYQTQTEQCNFRKTTISYRSIFFVVVSSSLESIDRKFSHTMKFFFLHCFWYISCNENALFLSSQNT